MSRGSTASIHSASTQPNIDQTYVDATHGYAAQWLPADHNQPRGLAPVPHDLSADALILQAAQQLQSGRDFSLDMSAGAALQHVPFHPSQALGRQSLSAESFAGNVSFADDSQMLDGNEEGDSFSGMPGNGKSTSRSSANNELEMRQLYVSNKHRTLVDVAEELHGNERGPNSERTRQVFAMLW